MQGIDVDAGILLYRCRGVAVGEGTAHAAHAEHDHGVGVAALAAALPLSAALPPDPNVTDVRRLSSRPSARIKIYLNFWGAEVRYTAQWVALPAVYAASVGALCLSPVCPPPRPTPLTAVTRTCASTAQITNSSWNSDLYPVISIPPYSKDNDSSTLSTAELQDIVAIWRAVKEDYKIFDVDVTTVQPESLEGHGYAVIGGDGSWFSAVPSGGVAGIGVFGRPFEMPAFVFPANLGPYFWRYVADAISHEVGHLLVR